MTHPVVDHRQQAESLLELGREFHASGWVPATSGNFSARVDAGRVAITISGRHKARLTTDDIIVVDLDGNSLSAETLLHTALYRGYPEVGGLLHTHSPAATGLSLTVGETLMLQGYELLKAFAGAYAHETQIRIPIFANDQDMTRLSAQVDAWIGKSANCFARVFSALSKRKWRRRQDLVES